MKKNFTGRQLSFMKAYVFDQNATKAAIEAGYSPKMVHVRGFRDFSIGSCNRRKEEDQWI